MGKLQLIEIPDTMNKHMHPIKTATNFSNWLNSNFSFLYAMNIIV